MKTFEDIFAIAAERHGGPEALEAKLEPPPPASEVAVIPDDRWLSMMTRSVFQAGFSWKVIEAKWPGFEEAFEGFDVGRCAMMDDDWFDSLVADKRIVRNPKKIRTVPANAVFLSDLAKEHGSAAAAFASWPSDNYVGLLDLIKTRGSHLGGTGGQYFLRMMGVDGFILSKDVVARLVAEGVVDKAPTGKGAMRKTQEAFNKWRAQSGRSLKEVSRVLAMSLG